MYKMLDISAKKKKVQRLTQNKKRKKGRNGIAHVHNVNVIVHAPSGKRYAARAYIYCPVRAVHRLLYKVG